MCGNTVLIFKPFGFKPFGGLAQVLYIVRPCENYSGKAARLSGAEEGCAN